MSVVIVGIDLRDAQAIAMTRREEDRGKHVVLVPLSLSNPRQRIEGLRVHEVEASPRAVVHRAWPDVLETLHRSRVLIGATSK